MFFRPLVARSIVTLLFILTLIIAGGPGCILAGENNSRDLDLDVVLSEVLAAPAGSRHLEVDSRRVPWNTIRRLALEAGLLLPPYQPVSAAEIVDLLQKVAAASGCAAVNASERQTLAYWLQHYGLGANGRVWRGCSCKENPPGLRFSVREFLTWSDLGSIVEREAGLMLPSGSNNILEPTLSGWAGSWWGKVTPRWRVRLNGSNRVPSPLLTYSEWPIATGRPRVGQARLGDDEADFDLPQVLVGSRFGNWALSAGWTPRSIGSGTYGNLMLDQTAGSFFAFTARRTKPYVWSGIFAPFDPEHLLVRVGTLSSQNVSARAGDGLHRRYENKTPYYFQWLVTFNHTPYLRTTLVHSAMSIARSGNIWKDYFQINFPALGVTWSEIERGPITDRLLALQMEACVQQFWWLLPESVSGRIYWDYGGEDFTPDSLLGIIPQISLPASVFGGELVSPGWDLGLEMSDLNYQQYIWYTSGNFSAHYSHDGWMLGHPDGSLGRSVNGWLRLRPWGFGWEITARGKHYTSGREGFTPGRVAGNSINVMVQRRAPVVSWNWSASWHREEYSSWTDEHIDAREDWFSTSIRFEY